MAYAPKAPKQRPARLSDFNPRYASHDFPLLAFLYAIVVGGEHALYCDFTEDYADKYLAGHFNDPDFEEQKAKLLKVLARLEHDRDPHDPPAYTVVPTHAEWDTICQVLAEELKRGILPTPVW